MKLFSKLFWSYVLIFILFVIFFLVFSYKTISNNYLKTSSHYLQEYNRLIMPMIIPLIEDKNYSELDEYVKQITPDIRITVINPQGLVLADSKNIIEDMDNHIDRGEVQDALEQGSGIRWRFSNTMGRKMLYYAHRLDNEEGKLMGYLRLSFFDYQLDELRSGLLEDVSQLVIFGIIAALLITFLLSRHFIKPVDDLAKAASAIGEGDFNIRLKPRTNDEIQELTVSFNSMLDHVQILINEIKSQKEALKCIIESISDILWVVNVKSENITIANSAFSSFFNQDSSDNKQYWEVVRSLELNNIIKETLLKRKSHKQEISILNHDFILSCTYMWETNSVLYLMNDVTAFKQLEQVKRDIVANASHELRTPLASIKGYTEMLEDMVNGEEKQIVGILQRNINRLSSLLDDILVLSHLEEITSLDLALTDVSKLLDNVCLLYKLRLKDKGLTLIRDFEDNIMAYLDAYRFEQLVNNLLDNAIKYTPQGSITLSLHRNNGHLVFVCCDTGVGIPRKLQERIFERFFVVDKSRSRKMGGTGLGLSIVKHIVNLHQGKIELQSEQGKGCCFKVTLPANE